MPRFRHSSRWIVATLVPLAVPAIAAFAQVPTIEKLTWIGCADCTGSTLFSAIFDAAVTDSGEIVVADRSAPMIRAFDRTGKLLWTMGRSGNGPGEFLFPMRVAIGPDRSVSVVDMRTSRLTRLAKDGTLIGSHRLPGFPAATAARGRTGDVMLVLDDFRNALTAERWPAAAAKPERHATLPRRTSGPPGMVQPSIAVASSGVMAFVLDPFTYRIGRLDAAGKPMPDIVRDIPPARRTDAEMKELADRLASGPGRRVAENGNASVAAGAAPPGIDLSLKPHVRLDGMRFDDAGRLWVLSMRGIGGQSVFDIFAPAGAFLGSLTLPAEVSTFSLAGSYLVTAGEDADGIPHVTLWRVRG